MEELPVGPWGTQSPAGTYTCHLLSLPLKNETLCVPQPWSGTTWSPQDGKQGPLRAAASLSGGKWAQEQRGADPGNLQRWEKSTGKDLAGGTNPGSAHPLAWGLTAY